MKIKALFVYLCSSIFSCVFGADGTWTATGSGSWSQSANWLNGVVAGGVGDKAYFTSSASAVTVTNDLADLRVQALVFNGGDYQVAGQLITVEGSSSGDYGLNVLAGTARLATPVSINRHTQVVVQDNATLTLDGMLTYVADKALWTAKKGNGTLAIANTFVMTNDCNFGMQGGLVRLCPGARLLQIRGSFAMDRNHLKIGYSGKPSTLLLETNSTMQVESFSVGCDTYGFGRMLVDGGVCTAWGTLESGVLVGERSPAELVVTRGGSVTISNYLHVGAFAAGSLIVTNGGSLSAGVLVLGERGSYSTNDLLTGISTVRVSAATAEVRNQLYWRYGMQSTRTNTVVVSEGGLLVLPATDAPAAGAAIGGNSQLLLRDGTLKLNGVVARSTASLTNYLNDLSAFYLGNGRTAVHVDDVECQITQPLQMEPGLSVLPSTLFAKMGSGTLTLQQGFAYPGLVAVAQGTLKIIGTNVPAWCTLSGGTRLDVADGVCRTVYLDVLQAGIERASECVVDIGLGGASDQFHVKAPVLGAVTWVLRSLGATSGTYTLLRYEGEAPSLAAWRVVAPAGLAATLSLDTANRRVVAVCAPTSNDDAVWLAPGSGTWSEAANWNHLPVTTATFSNAVRQDLSATLTASVALDTITIQTPYTVTLQGGDLTVGELAVQSGKLLLATSVAGRPSVLLSGNGVCALAQGNILTSPLTVNGNTLEIPDNLLSQPLTVAERGATLQIPPAATITVPAPVAGSGALQKPGSNILTLSDSSAFTGSYQVLAGTVMLSSLSATGGDLVLGPGSLVYAGPTTTSARNVVIATSDRHDVGTLVVTNDVTLTGTFNGLMGGFLKLGPGKLTLNGTGAQALLNAKVERDVAYCINRDAFGNSPTKGMRMLNIAEGTLEVGNVNQSFDWTQEAIIVGAETALAGQIEKAAHLIINSNASVRCGYLSIGRGNGQTTTAPTPLTSSITVNGALIQTSGIWLGNQLGDMSDCTAQPLLTINGGCVTTFVVRCGSGVNNKAKNRIVLNDGLLVVIGDKTADSPLIHSGGGDALLTINGGLMKYTKIPLQLSDPWAGTNCSATVVLNGGELSVSGWNKGGGLARVIFNGGTLRLSASTTLSALTETRVGAGGALLAAEGAVTLEAPLTHDADLGGVADGGLTWLGSGTLILAGANTYTGPTTIQAGTMRMAGSLAQTDLRIQGTGRLSLIDGTNTTITCDAIACAQNGCIDLEIGDSLVLPASMTGNLRIALFTSGGATRYVKAGRVAVARCAAATLDVSGWQLEGLPQARFSFENDTVYVTTGSGEDGVSEWLNPAGGAWSTAANWSNAPIDSVQSDVYFGSALTQATLIAVDRAVTVGSLMLDTPQPCTFAGQSLSLGDATHAGTLYSAAGVQTFNSALLAPFAGAVNLQSNSVISMNGGFQGAVTVSGGRVVLTNAASSGTLALNASTLDLPESRVLDFQLAVANSAVITQQALKAVVFTQPIAGSGQLDKWGAGLLSAPAFQGRLNVNRGWMMMENLPGALMIGPASFGYTGATTGTLTNGYRVVTDLVTQAAVFSNDTDVVVDGPVRVERGAFVKLGAGTLTYTGAGNNILSQGDNMAAGGSRLMLSPDGSSPTQGYRSYSIYNGRVILGAEGQTNAFAQAVIVGGQTTTNAGAETAAELIIQGGMVTNTDFFAIGRGNGTPITAPTGLVSRMVMNEGWVVSKGLYMGARLSDMSDVNARPEYIHNGGTHLIFERIQMGDASGGNPRPRIVVNGGTILHTGGSQILLAGGAGCIGELTLSGGTLVSSNTLYLVRDCPGQATIHLNSGRLNVGNLAADRATNGLAVVNFNGATLGFCVPTVNTISGVHQLNVLEGGAKIDVAQGASIIITNRLQSGVGSGTDGGLIKSGAGVLALQASPTYSGATRINEGLFSLTAPCIMPSDLSFASGTTLRVRATAEQWLASTTTAVLNVTGDLQFSEGASIELLAWDYNSVPTTRGTYRVVACSGTVTLPQGRIAVAGGAQDRAYTFTVSEDGKTLLLTIGDPVQETVWKNTQGGLWSTASNWHVAPGTGAANMVVGFSDSITTDAVITVDQAFTAGHLRFNSSKAYTLAGTEGALISGTNAAVSVLKGRANIEVPMQLEQALTVVVNSNSTAQFAGPLSGQGAIMKEGASGELALLGNNTYAGGTVVNGSGVLVDVAGGSPLGTGAVTLNQWGSVRTLNDPAAISNHVIFTDDWYVTTPASLVLGGDWTSRNEGRLIKQGSGELVVAGRIQPGNSGKARLNVREGSVRLTAGAEVTLTNAAVREALTFGNPSAGADYRAVIMEPGSKMTATCLWMGGSTKSNIVEVNQAELYLPGYANVNTPDALVLTPGGNSSNLCSVAVNGGALVTGDAGWVILGVDQGNSRLVINNGSASLGQVSFGMRDTVGYGTPGIQADITVVSNGSLVVRNRLNWNGWSAVDRVNTLALNGGFASLPPTFAAPTNAGLSQVVFNGGTMSLPGGGWDAESPTNYLSGLSRIVVGKQGGNIDVPLNRSVGIRQTVMQDSAWTGTVSALRKCGLGSLSLQRVPRFKGELDVYAGRVEQIPQTRSFLPDGILFAYDFADSLTQDASGNGYTTQIKTVIAPSKVVNGTVAGRMAATFNKNDYLLVSGSNWDQIETFTINVWTYFSSWQTVNQQKTLLGNLTQTSTPGAHEYLLRVMENGGFRIIATGEDKVTFGQILLDVTNAVSLNTWCMLSMVVNGTNGVTLYVNGQQRPINVTAPAGYGGNKTGAASFGAGKNWRLTSRSSGTIYALGAVSTSEPSGLIGSMSDVQVYTRCLAPTELNQLYAYDFASAPPIAGTAVRVRRGAEYRVNGAVHPVGVLSGEGRVTGGRIAVQRALSPGDSDTTAAGAQLSATSLQVGTNVVCRCAWSSAGVDRVCVENALIIDGAGVIDLGLDATAPLPNVPRYQTIPVMTYGSISNAAYLATWTVQGTGLRSSAYRASVEAVNNQVVVKTEVFSGMVLIVK